MIMDMVAPLTHVIYLNNIDPHAATY